MLWAYIFLGVTQLLDQLNRALHLRYKNSKHELFTTARNIDREGFMHILANMWNGLVSKQSLLKAAKRVGVTATGLNVNFIQTEKFEQVQAFWKETTLMKFTKHHMLMCYHFRTSGRILHSTGNQISCQHKLSLKNHIKRTYSLTKFLAFLRSKRLLQKEPKQTSGSHKCADQWRANICSKW